VVLLTMVLLVWRRAPRPSRAEPALSELEGAKPARNSSLPLGAPSLSLRSSEGQGGDFDLDSNGERTPRGQRKRQPLVRSPAI